MKFYSNNKLNLLVILFTMTLSYSVFSQVGAWDPELETNAQKELAKILKDSPKLETFKSNAYGYAIFPKVTKAGLAIGGAGGKGLVYKNHTIVGASRLSQVSYGLQAGGQQYSEFIFFENKESFDKFVNDKFKFSAQASAVAVTAGASVDAAYQDGVAVFTRAQGGLMYEASIGGQKFKFEANK